MFQTIFWLSMAGLLATVVLGAKSVFMMHEDGGFIYTPSDELASRCIGWVKLLLPLMIVSLILWKTGA